MPIIGRRGQPAANPLQRSFIERIKAGRVVPILSDEALFDLVLGGHLSWIKTSGGLFNSSGWAKRTYGNAGFRIHVGGKKPVKSIEWIGDLCYTLHSKENEELIDT